MVPFAICILLPAPCMCANGPLGNVQKPCANNGQGKKYATNVSGVVLTLETVNVFVT